MSLIKTIKNFIPITFGILFIITCFILSIFAFLGLYPFKLKSNELGVLFILLFLFGFYLGMSIGNFISYLLDICITDKSKTDKSKTVLIMPKTATWIHYEIKRKNPTRSTTYIDF